MKSNRGTGRFRGAISLSMMGAAALTGAAGGARADQAADPAKAQASPAQGVQEIVVTATKSSQSVQKVSAAVTALGGAVLAQRGVSNLSQLQDLAPSIRLQAEAVSTEIYIRGVGSSLDFPNIEPFNAYNIDGVYIPREVSSAELYDVGQAEVLPGPQGTLYGRGAIGGAVNMSLRRPTSRPELDGLIEGGNFGLAHTTLTGNLPVNDQLSVRASFNSDRRDGYLTSGAGSVDTIGGRVSALYRPTNNLSAYVWAQYEQKEGTGDNAVTKGSRSDPTAQTFVHPDNPWNDSLSGVYAPLGSPTALPLHWRAWIVGGEFKWDLRPGLSLTYIPSYVNLDWHQGYWLTHKPSDFREKIDQTTHELRANYDAGNFKVVGGLYAYRLQTSGQLFIDFAANDLGPGVPSLWLDATDVRSNVLEGVATFAHVTYSFTDKLRFVVGGRYSYDKRTGWGFVPAPVSGPSPSAAVGGPKYASLQNFYHSDWKAGVEYDVAPRSMIYFNVQTGYQPGTFDTFPGVDVKSTELTAYTAGSKNRFLDGRLTLNNELFYYDYTNYLAQAFDSGTGSNRLFSAPRATIYGDQLDASLEIDPADHLNVNIGYAHGKFDNFVLPPGTVPGSSNNFNGYQLMNAPDWTVNMGLQHKWNLASGAIVEGEVDTHYESSFWGTFEHTPGLFQAAYTKTDVTLTYRPANRAWSIALWAKNLEDTPVQSASAPSGALDAGPGTTYLEAPRTYGVRATVRFGG